MGNHGNRNRLFLFSAIPAILLACAALLPAFLSTDDRAEALTLSEWDTIRTRINDYVNSQYAFSNDGEGGFLMSADVLKDLLDSNDDMNPMTGIGVLGEGDDAALAPLLVDVLGGSPSWIPGTSYRIPAADNWFGAANPANSAAIRSLLQKREAAGFSYDIVTYCLTGHTESPAIMAYGAMGQAGFFGTTHAPMSFGLKWGRYGWNTGSVPYPNAKPLTSSTTVGNFAPLPSGSIACSGQPEAELLRCAANEAMNSINANGGVGAGINPWPVGSDFLYAPVDIRNPGGPYMANQSTLGAYAMSAPLNQLFNNTAYLNKLYTSGKLNIFVNRTQHTGLMAATGAQMLGYPSESMKWGLANWNNTLPEKFTGGAGGPLVNTPIDSTPPVVENVRVDGITHDSMTFSRHSNEPATMKVEYGTAPGVYTNVVNDTVLNADKSVVVTGLTPLTDYYFRITSYDGMANGAVSDVPLYFTTYPIPDIPYRPDIAPLADPSSYWASYADYTSRELSVDVRIANRGALEAFNVCITGASNTNWVTLSSPLPVYVGNIEGYSDRVVTLRYHIPPSVGYMLTRLQGSACDNLDICYEYP